MAFALSLKGSAGVRASRKPHLPTQGEALAEMSLVREGSLECHCLGLRLHSESGGEPWEGLRV